MLIKDREKMRSIDILVPDLPESVVNATITTWHKKIGDSVQRDEVLVELETDKVILEVTAPNTGVLEGIIKEEGATVMNKQVLGRLCLNDHYNHEPIDKYYHKTFTTAQCYTIGLNEISNEVLSPAVRRLVKKYDLQPANIKKSGVWERLTREDVEKYITKQHSTHAKLTSVFGERSEKRVPMTNLRKRIAERLLEAKNSTAMLTTFNEVNMKSVIDLRKQYGELFKKRHGVRLGFMSFYIKAVLEALKRFPEVNAFIDGEDIVYHNYFDINIAVSTPRGLVTPILKNVNILGMADIERHIKEFAVRGRDGKLGIEALTGGNFTITNSGIFGSMISTPIINPPQSAILGMHAIKDRPMVVNNQVVILPMMYLALSYDHRLIDGKESVSFLVTVKEMLENPIRLLLDV